MGESRTWRRGFAAGFTVLALSVGGQMATSSEEAASSRVCSVSGSRFVDRLADRFTPDVDAHSIAHRVARAVLGVVLQTCS